MATLINQIVTEEYIKTLIDNGTLLPNLQMVEYGKKAVSKQHLLNLTYADIDTLSTLSHSQLVRSDLVKTGFGVSLVSGSSYGYVANSIPFKTSTLHGWTYTKNASWITVSPVQNPTIGVQNATLNIIANPETNSRSGKVTFKEIYTNRTIVLDIAQEGKPSTGWHQVSLYYGGDETEVCKAMVLNPFYIQDGFVFNDANYLSTVDTGVNSAPVGYYKEPFSGWRRWNGSSFTERGVCAL